MARARTIKPAFFRNEELAEVSAFGRLLFIGLWTISDREGRQEYRPKRIKADVFPYDDVSVKELLVELHDRKLVVLYDTPDGRKVIFIPGFVKHQRPHPNEPKSELPSLEESTTCKSIVTKHDDSRKNTSSCALPSSNPLIPLPLPEREEKSLTDLERKVLKQRKELTP